MRVIYLIIAGLVFATAAPTAMASGFVNVELVNSFVESADEAVEDSGIYCLPSRDVPILCRSQTGCTGHNETGASCTHIACSPALVGNFCVVGMPDKCYDPQANRDPINGEYCDAMRCLDRMFNSPYPWCRETGE